MANISNVSLIARGINNVRAGIEKQEVGAAEVARGLLEVWRTPFRWSYGAGDTETWGLTTIAEMYHVRLNEKTGKTDNKALPAMYDAIADNFGFSWGEGKAMRSKLLMMFKRAWRVAAAKAEAGLDVRFENGGKAVSVPLSAVVQLVDDAGEVTARGKEIVEAIKENALDDNKELTDEQALELAHKRRVTCDGKAHKRYGEVPAISALADKVLVKYTVEAGAEPAPAPRAPRADAGTKFLDCVEFVSTQLDALMSSHTNGGDESPLAFNADGEGKLRKCAELIAAYFASAPVSGDIEF